MVFFGIVVAAAAVAIGAAVITGNSSSASLSIFGQHVPGVHTEAEVFGVGVLVAIVIVAGIGLSSMSLLRSARARREFRDLKDDHEESISALVRRNHQLQRELAHARSGAPSAPTTSDVPVYPQARA